MRKALSIAVFFVFAFFASASFATTYTTTAPGGKWSEIAWSPSAPVAGADTEIVIDGAGAFVNDLGEFRLNGLVFKKNASLSGDKIVFVGHAGANPHLTSVGAVIVEQNAPLQLDAPLIWSGNNASGSMRLNGNLSGSGDLIHDPTVVNIVDYINGNNASWSGNCDQRLSFLVVSNSANLGTGSYYCTNLTQRASGRNTLRIYNSNTFNNDFYFSSEANSAAARVDIFGNTVFNGTVGVQSTKFGILAESVQFQKGIYNWNPSDTARNCVFTSSKVSPCGVYMNGPVSIGGTLSANAYKTANEKYEMKLHLCVAGNSFQTFQGIAGGNLVLDTKDAYPQNVQFQGQMATSSKSWTGGVIDLNGHDALLGKHVTTASPTSFVISNTATATLPQVTVTQDANNLFSTLQTFGPMNFVKAGSATLDVTNDFSVAGILEITAGTMCISGPVGGRLADHVIVRSGATLDLGGARRTCGTLTLDGGSLLNGTLIADQTDLRGGTLDATLPLATLSKSGSGAISYPLSLSSTPTLSREGLVFYLPFDDVQDYLVDQGPDGIEMSCQKTVKHTSLGTATRDTSAAFGAGCLKLDGKSPLAPVNGVFPAHVPTGANPYTVAIYYRLSSAANTSVGMLGYGARSAGKGNNYSFAVLSGCSNFVLMNNYYWSKDLRAFLGNGASRNDGSWHSLVSTWDGERCRIWDDGAEVKLSGVSRTPTDPPSVVGDFFWVGATLNGNAWNGWLDEVAIWNRAITEDEVAAYHAAGVIGGTNVHQTISVEEGTASVKGMKSGLVFHLPFDSADDYLEDKGPDRVQLVCQKTTKHTAASGGTAVFCASDKKFGSGSVQMNGVWPLVASSFPQHVPAGAEPYTVACAFKYASGTISSSPGWLGYGAAASNQGNNYAPFNALSGYADYGVLNNYYWGNDARVDSGATLNDGKWHTCVATWNGSSWRYWFDGSEKYMLSYGRATTKTAPNVQRNLFWVGATLNGTAWNGWLDELAIWNRALTPAEAVAYNEGGVSAVGAVLDSSLRLEVAGGATLDVSDAGLAVAGTLAGEGTISGDLTLADGVVVEGSSAGALAVDGEVSIAGAGVYVPAVPSSTHTADWTILTASGGFAAGSETHAPLWHVDGIPAGSREKCCIDGTSFAARIFPLGTVLILR